MSQNPERDQLSLHQEKANEKINDIKNRIDLLNKELEKLNDPKSTIPEARKPGLAEEIYAEIKKCNTELDKLAPPNPKYDGGLDFNLDDDVVEAEIKDPWDDPRINPDAGRAGRQY